MNMYIKRMYSIMFLLCLLCIAACSSTNKREGAGEYIDDSVITARVKAAILQEKSLKVAEINVETFKGVVQLSGFVSSKSDEQKAVSVARNIGGVKSVKDDMQVK